mgnify:CR=1 FL=1
MTLMREEEKPWKTDLARKAAQRRERVAQELEETIKKAPSFEEALRLSVAEMRDLVHRYREARSGEAWERGPLILSWADADQGRNYDGWNVIVHEAAHKLDALDGGTNGKPPLHANMRVEDWSRDFHAAYEDLERRVDAGLEPPIDDYALESPAEFFAVASEAFFEAPDLLEAAYPAVYHQLREFYRQDPLARLGPFLGPTEPLSPSA